MIPDISNVFGGFGDGASLDWGATNGDLSGELAFGDHTNAGGEMIIGSPGAGAGLKANTLLVGAAVGLLAVLVLRK